jgi:hypothetical protein
MTRRKRRALVRESLILWAGIAVVLLAVTAWHLFGWLAATTAIAGAAWWLGRRSGAQNRRAPREVTSRGRQMPQIGTARTRANGWTQPASRLYSAECARSDCTACRDPRCSCTDCPHAYRQAAVRTAAPEEPPF